MRRESLARAIGLFAVVVWVSPALAKDRKAPPPPAQVQQIFDCRAISDDAGRLACFDAQVESFEDAVEKQDVRIFDRAAADKARRSLFGFTLRDLPFFGDDDDGKEGVQRIESTIKWARREGYNQVRFEIEEGGGVGAGRPDRLAARPAAGRQNRDLSRRDQQLLGRNRIVETHPRSPRALSPSGKRAMDFTA